jgi:hypothetical protein
MSEQELIFRMFICEFVGFYTSEAIIVGFGMEHTLANRILTLFPRENHE